MRFILSMLMISALALGLACQSTSSSSTETKNEKTAADISKTEKPAETEKKAVKEDADGHDGESQRISLADAKKDFDAGNVVIIDTRSENAYNNEHIKGSINVPAGDFDKTYKKVPKDKKIIAYCSWPSENTSARVVQMLMDKGYENAFALVGGTEAWKNAGYPMETASK